MIPLTVTDVRALPGDSAFLIDDGVTAVLYDTGFGFTGYSVADNVQRILGNRPLDYILLTHSHYDHALGSAYIRKRYPQVRIVAGEYAQSVFLRPTARSVMRKLDKQAAAGHGVEQYEDLVDDLRADITVKEGDTVTCGQMRFTVVELPGHTKCSVGYYLAENGLLLSTESLGVCFGPDAYQLSFLVGYQMTLDSIEKAKKLEIRQVLIPHYGLVSGQEARKYLDEGEKSARMIARLILDQLKLGKDNEEIMTEMSKVLYTEAVRPAYPYDAYRMNTEIMINLIRKELFSV